VIKDVSGKTIKKREHNMSTGSKNGKVHTFNIYSIILFSAFILAIYPATSVAAPKKNGKWVIVIDPGHGGRDPGAPGSFSKEKNITLAIALKTAKYIRENIKDATVIMTRDDDSTVDLYERPKIANRNNADLFISIHANAMPKGIRTTMGAETWIMGLASNEENLAVAMKENEVILLEDDYSTKYENFDPKSPESYIIFTLTQNLYQKQSTDLAQKIQTQFSERADRKDRGVKQAGFVVLYQTTMPSVLIETGFISTPTEEKYLNSEQGQDYLASAIYRACRDYITEVDLRSNINTKPVTTPSTSSGSSGSSTKKSNTTVPDNIIFTVQVAAATTRTQASPENFKGIEDIRELRTGERYRYVTGTFEDYSEAVIHRKKIERLYPDAFVIALQNNKILPLQQALEKKRKK
jgi:N-acetylmuramoyl-L-alanine amidase